MYIINEACKIWLCPCKSWSGISTAFLILPSAQTGLKVCKGKSLSVCHSNYRARHSIWGTGWAAEAKKSRCRCPSSVVNSQVSGKDWAKQWLTWEEQKNQVQKSLQSSSAPDLEILSFSSKASLSVICLQSLKSTGAEWGALDETASCWAGTHSLFQILKTEVSFWNRSALPLFLGKCLMLWPEQCQ